jgi:uncharacterized membrane protein
LTEQPNAATECRGCQSGEKKKKKKKKEKEKGVEGCITAMNGRGDNTLLLLFLLVVVVLLLLLPFIVGSDRPPSPRERERAKGAEARNP